MQDKAQQTYSYIYIFKWIYARLQKFRKRQFWALLIGMLCVAILETIALASVAFFASSITEPVNVFSSKYLNFVNQFFEVSFLHSENGLIISSGLLMIFLITIKNSIKTFVNYRITRFSIANEAYFGEILLNGFLTLPYQWHLVRNTADLVNAVQWRIFLGRNFFQPCLIILNDVLMISIMLILLFIVQPINLFIILFVLGGSAYFIYTVIRVLIDKTSTIAANYELTINKEATMSIHGVKDVKISQKEKAFVSKFVEKALPLSKVSATQRFYSEAPAFILETVGFGMLYISICIMLLKFNNTTAYVTGSLALLAVTAWKVIPAVAKTLGSATAIRGALPYIKHMIDYFVFIEADKGVSLHKQINAYDSFHFLNNIRFNEVSFVYQGSKQKVIQNFNFEIKKGDTIGVIGASGSGKSTLVDILIGLLQPVQGTVTMDDNTLTPELLPQWLKLIGYVSQSPYIYDGTIAENVAFGIESKELDRDRVRECCHMAAMDDFLYDLPGNIDSFIGERGVKLSGGQQQRVAIARSLYNKPEIMIFDEATSSLDTKSEKLIQDTIYSFKGTQTLIIVAHRLSTVKDCDRIIWLDKGKIMLQGETEKILTKYQQMMNN